MVRRRIRILMLLVTLPFLLVVARLWSLQVDLASHVEMRGQARRATLELDRPRRGRILDRHGKVLATNIERFSIEFKPAELNPRRPIIESVAAILSQSGPFPSPDEIEEHLRRLAGPDALRAWLEAPEAEFEDSFQEDIPLIEAISEKEAGAIEKVLSRRGGRTLFRLVRAGRPSTAVRSPTTYELRARLPHALHMELVLARLARRLPHTSFETLLRRASEVREEIERRIAKSVERARRAGVGRLQLLRKARTERILYRSRYWPLAGDVPLETVALIEYHPERFGGLRVTDSSHRFYPLGEAAAALVGYLRPLTQEEIDRLASDYRFLDDPEVRRLKSVQAFEILRRGGLTRSDRVGALGLEAAYDETLRGLYGMRLVVRDHRGKPRGILGALRPEAGSDIRTSLDAALQERLYRRLASLCRPQGTAAGASAVVIEVESGAVLAQVGYPSFDPNRLSEPGYLESLARRYGSKAGYFLDRPRLQALPPGSVFKIASALAALHSREARHGPLSPATTYECTYTFELSDRLHCASRYAHGVPGGRLDLVEALQYSCNTYFYWAAVRHLSPGDLVTWASHLGFGRPTGIDLPPHRLASGILRPPQSVTGLGLCQYAIGQSYLSATPLQVVRLAAAAARGFDALPRPWLVEPREPEPLPPVRRDGVQAIREGMRRALGAPGGTAAAAELGLGRFDAAVKTGTAQFTSEGGIYHGWLAGFAPYEKPRFAFAVCVEKTPLHGGAACAPIAELILEYLLEEKGGSSAPASATPHEPQD